MRNNVYVRSVGFKKIFEFYAYRILEVNQKKRKKSETKTHHNQSNVHIYGACLPAVFVDGA